MAKKRAYIGTVVLYDHGIDYGGTTRQVNAQSKADAIKILKKNFKFGNNKVVVSNVRLASEVHKETWGY